MIDEFVKNRIHQVFGVSLNTRHTRKKATFLAFYEIIKRCA
jgi:hypothetical protein